MYMPLRPIAATAAAAATLIVASPALAQTSAQNGYSHPAGSVQQRLEGPRAPVRASAVEPSDPGRLPFSGLDVALVAAAGGVLLLIGASVRLASRPDA